jgi:hypothetical protein
MVLAAPDLLLTPPPSSSPPKTPHRSYSAQIQSQNEEKIPHPPNRTCPYRRELDIHVIVYQAATCVLDLNLLAYPLRCGVEVTELSTNGAALSRRSSNILVPEYRNGIRQWFHTTCPTWERGSCSFYELPCSRSAWRPRSHSLPRSLRECRPRAQTLI